MASRHLTLRMPADALERLERESERTGQSRSELARTLIEEGLRMQRHPGIIFRDGAAGRRPGLAAGLDVWELVSAFREFDGTEDERVNQVAEHLWLTPYQVRDGLRYYAEFKDEIDNWIDMVDREAKVAHADWLRAQAVLAD